MQREIVARVKLHVCRKLFIKNSNMKFLALFISNKHVSETNRKLLILYSSVVLYIDKAIQLGMQSLHRQLQLILICMLTPSLQCHAVHVRVLITSCARLQSADLILHIY